MDSKDLKKIGLKAYEEYEKDTESRQMYDQKRKEWHELFYQTHAPESPPWTGASEESIPILAEACMSYQSRGYKAMFPARDFIQSIPMDAESKDDKDLAMRIGKHMSYQLGVKDRRYKKDKRAMLLATPKEGCDFTKTWFDPIRKQVRVKRVRTDDLIVPYGVGPRELEDIERISEKCRMSINQSRILAKNEFFLKPLKDTDTEEQAGLKQQAEDFAQGLNESRPYDSKMGLAIEQHTLLSLTGEDDIAYPYIVIFDYNTKEVLRIQENWEVDTAGKAMDEDRRRIEYYTKYGFLTNPDGFYDLGYGHLVAKLNVAINKMLRQAVDAGTLANFGNMSGFISDSLGTKGDQLQLEIGQFIKLPQSVDDIRKAIYQFQFPGANPSHVSMLEMLVETAQRVSNTTDPVTGDVGKVLQPLTIMTLLESSLQLPTSVMEQQAAAFEEELEKVYRLNRNHLPETDRFMADGEMLEVTKQDYQSEMRVIPIMDPRMITKQQKIAKAQELFTFILNNPLTAQDPKALREATKDVLQALEAEDIERYLTEEPEIQRFDDPIYENVLFMLPASKRPIFSVHPDQNHTKHIRVIDALIKTLNEDIDPDITDGAGLGPESVEGELIDDVTLQITEGVGDEMKTLILTDLMQHRMEHIAYKYAYDTGVLEHGQGSPGQLVPLEGNQLDINPATGAVEPVAAPQALPIGAGGTPPGPGGGIGLPGIPPRGVTGLATLDIGEEE